MSATSASPSACASSVSDSGRVVNLNAGPAALPLSVLLEAQAELLNWHGTGMSVMEMSHRSKHFESILARSTTDLRELLQLPDNFKVIYKQGGGTSQFSAIALNFLGPDQTADYIVTGAWSQAAAKEAARFGRVNIAASSESTNFNHVPDPSTWKLTPNAAYLFYCHNETVHGSSFSMIPSVPDTVPLICDMSSSFMAAPIPDIHKYSLIFAGAQKNVGPAGLTIVIIRDDLLAKAPVQKSITPIMYNYKLLAEKDSMYNTPPCFTIYMTGLVLAWLKREGGLSMIGQRNAEKAAKLYQVIDEHHIYTGVVRPECRSSMNVTFLVGGNDDKLTNTFVKQAEQHGIVGIAGHRSVGGLRASLYNATTLSDVEKLVQFMHQFAREHGDKDKEPTKAAL